MDVMRFVLLAVLLSPVLGRTLTKKNEQQGRQNNDRDIFEQRVSDNDVISLLRVKRTDVSEAVPIKVVSEIKEISRARRSNKALSAAETFESDVIFPRSSPMEQVILSRVKRRHV